MKFLYYSIFLLMLYSCASNKDVNVDIPMKEEGNETISEVNENQKDTSFNVSIYIQKQEPYCGGAAPPDELLNRHSPVTDDFFIINLNDQSKTKVRTVDGYLKLQLEKGKYQVFEAFKQVPFHEFLEKFAKQPSGNNYQSLGAECYENWWKAPLIEFEVTNEQTILFLEATIQVGCYTGINPCVMYTGPFPP